MPAVKPATKKASAATATPPKPDFAAVFAALRRVLEPFAGASVAVQRDEPGNYHLEVPSILHRKKPLYFAGVRTNKNYVSFYLMCSYYSPESVKSMSAALRKRKQGKACFNFTEVDPECFAELGRLAAEGLKKFKSEEFRKYIQSIQ
jgi:hypothetical protein